MKSNLSGNIAAAFIQSKLTILLMIGFLLIGVYSTFLIPREEEPQIKVPIADIFIGYPGASPKDVETKVIAPLERMVSAVKGVEYVYSTSMKGQGMLVVQFYVGEDIERSQVKLYSELMKNMDKMPPGVTMPLIKTRSIDDVPVFGLTLWSEKYSDYDLRKIAQNLAGEIKKVPDVGNVNLIGGRSEELSVDLNLNSMAVNSLDFLSIAAQIEQHNAQGLSGVILSRDTAFSVVTGNFLNSAEELEHMLLKSAKGTPVYLNQVAKISDGPESAKQYVNFSHHPRRSEP